MNVFQMEIIIKYSVIRDEIYNVKKKLEKNINNFLSTDIEWIPINNIEISKEEKDKQLNF